MEKNVDIKFSARDAFLHQTRPKQNIFESQINLKVCGSK